LRYFLFVLERPPITAGVEPDLDGDLVVAVLSADLDLDFDLGFDLDLLSCVGSVTCTILDDFSGIFLNIITH